MKLLLYSCLYLYTSVKCIVATAEIKEENSSLNGNELNHVFTGSDDRKTPPRYHHSSSLHPLDPLSAEEISLTSKIISRISKFIFIVITLQEPPKDLLAPYFLNNTNPPKGTIRRLSFSLCIDKSNGTVIEYVVDLDEGAIFTENILQMGVEPLFTDDDLDLAEDIVKKDPEFIERCDHYGYRNLSLVYATGWTMGYVEDKRQYRGKRLSQMLIYGQQFPEDNCYGHPLPFSVVVDMLTQKVIDFLDCPTGYGLENDNSNVTVPKALHNYDQDLLGKDFLRKDVKPISVTSPDGPSYTVKGYKIEWQKWSFRVGFNGREGLVLHWINYNDNGNVRPLIYRAAVSEMWIFYGDPRPPTGPRKNVFDEGEFGLGFDALESIAQEDCLGSVYFFDGVVNENNGRPKTLPHSICVYEEDAGLLWKHQDEVSGKINTVRSHRLAVTFSMQSGNYNYIFHWYFYQDASMEFLVKLTGILNPNLLAKGAQPPPYGTLVADQVFAQFHQHFFCVRMDTDINGRNNSAETVDIISPDDLPNSFNPFGNAMISKHTLLKTTGEARTKNSPNTSRIWKFSNPSVNNPVQKKPVSYILKSENKGPPLWKIDSPGRHRGNFTAYDVWVTLHDDKQIYAGGDYLDGNGLPEWVNKDQNTSIVNEDIVMWHVFGITHNVRMEDWPVMPAESTGFWFKPANFFTSNPGLDVPNVHKDKKKDSSR